MLSNALKSPNRKRFIRPRIWEDRKTIYRFTLSLQIKGLLFVVMSFHCSTNVASINERSADRVLGQPNFSQTTAATTASQFDAPESVAVDPITGKIFVSEFNNNRVLRFSAQAALENGSEAEAVFGQVDFESKLSRQVGANTLNTPSKIFVDLEGRLWVADTNHDRILRFDHAATKMSGADADGVLGQPNFNSRAIGTNTKRLNKPTGLFVDDEGTLWVADAKNNRVLRFDNAATKPNGAEADGVLGQPDFTSDFKSTTPNGMNFPYDVVLDKAGNLFVSDNDNHRVLRFNEAALKTNGASADQVLGQPDFQQNQYNTTESTMNNPGGLTVDSMGRLYVADTLNHRILIYHSVFNKENGATADDVLGQEDFVSRAPNRGGSAQANTLYKPIFLFFDQTNNQLWVGEEKNNRVVRYSLPSSNITMVSKSIASAQVTQGTSNHILYQIQISASTAQIPLMAVTLNPQGSYHESDIMNFKLYYSTNAKLDEADILLSVNPVVAAGESILFPDLSQPLTVGSTNYLFLTADIAQNAGIGRTIYISQTPLSHIIFAEGISPIGNTPLAAAGLQYFATKSRSSQSLPRTMIVFAEIKGQGQGHVSSNPGGIYCESQHCLVSEDTQQTKCDPDYCRDTFETATEVNLIATAEPGSVFLGWGGHQDCTDGKLWLIGNRLCIAYFNPVHTVTLSTVGAGEIQSYSRYSGSIHCDESSPSSACTGLYNYNTLAYFLAVPAEGSEFLGWNGDCQGECNSFSLLVTEDKSCTAYFGEIEN